MAKQHLAGAPAPVVPATDGPRSTDCNSPAKPGAALDLGICIELWPRAYTTYRGTAAQLVAEGLVPAHFAFPAGSQMESWDQGEFSYSVFRSRPSGMSGKEWRDSAKDHWLMRRGLVSGRGQGLQAATVYEAEQELAKARQGRGLDWSEWQAALFDARFQSLLVAVGAKDAPKPRKARRTQS